MAMTSDQAWEEILAERARRRVNEWRRDRNHSLKKRSGYDVSQDWPVSIAYGFCCVWRIYHRRANQSKRLTIMGYGVWA